MKVNSTQAESGAFDIIGDIHGYADPLERLLQKLGYELSNGTYSHPQGRRVVFLGDFIDRGPEIRKTLQIVRAMVDAEHALAVMGNHEYNAVCFHTPDGKGGHLRSRTVDGGKNVVQHQATLDAFSGRAGEWAEWLAWFKQLPFVLDLEGFRAVHATWSPGMIDLLSGRTLEDDGFLRESAKVGSTEFQAIETVLKGIEIPLPEGHAFIDKQGHERPQIRVKWWERPEGKTYRDVAFPVSVSVPELPIDSDEFGSWSGYCVNEPPVFFGHYWLPESMGLAPVAPNAACLDYSVAKEGGRLAAYRWDGEANLSANKFTYVSTCNGVSI